MREFREVLEIEPHALDARKGLGLAQLALRRYAEALKSLSAVVDVVPNDATALGGLGRAHMGMGNPDRALAPLRKAAALRPNEAGLAFELGKSEAAAGHHQQAKRAFSRALALKPNSIAAAVGLAKARIATSEFVLAAEVLRPLADAPVPDTEALSTLIAAYDALKLEEEALRTRAKLADVLPPNEAVPLRLRIGRTYVAKLRWEEALAQFAAAVKSDPHNVDALVGLAQCYHALGKTEEEIAQWQAAGQLAPHDLDIWMGLATAFADSPDRHKALGALKQALKADPTHRQALEVAAETARALGELKLTEDYLRRILALNPRDTTARFAVVDILVAQGQTAKGLVEAGEALRQPKPPPEAYIKVACLAEQLGNYELAITQWRRLARLGGEHEAPASLELGRLLVKVHRAPEAIRLYRQLLEKRAAPPEVALGLARAHQSIGEDKQAAAVLRPLLVAHPDLLEARVALAESLAWLGEHDETHRQMREVLAAGPLSEQACRTLVLVCERSGRLGEATTRLEELIPAGAPEDVSIELLGKLYRHAHREAAGGRRLIELFDENPAHPKLGLAGAQLLAEAGEMTQAEQVLWGIARRPKLKEAALRQLVRMHATLGAPQRAIPPLRRLLEDDPTAAWVIAMLAEMQPRPDMLTQVSEAVIALADEKLGGPGFWAAAVELAQFLGRGATELPRLQALAAQRPQDPGIATGLAVLALYQGNPGMAQRAIAQVPTERQDDRVLLHTLARAQAALGRSEEAMVSIHRAMKGGRGLAEDHVLYAKLLRQSRRFEEALWHMVSALKLDSSDVHARQVIREVIESDELPPATVMEGLKYVYFSHPDAPVVFELVDALSGRPDAQQMCAQWLMQRRLPPESN